MSERPRRRLAWREFGAVYGEPSVPSGAGTPGPVWCGNPFPSARAGEASAADPGGADHVGVRAEDEPAHDVRRVDLGGVVGQVPKRLGQPGIDGDDVGVLAGLERADPILEPER